MTEYQRQRRLMAERRALAQELVAKKAAREALARKARAERETRAYAVQHGLKPERLVQPQPPQLTLSSGFTLRAQPRRPYDQSQRADQVLEDYGLR